MTCPVCGETMLVRSPNGHQGHLDGALAGLTRSQLLQCLAFVQGRRARDEVLQRLLEARLVSLTTAAATNGHDTLLTVSEAAKRLKLPKPVCTN